MLPSLADLLALTGQDPGAPIAAIRLGPRPLRLAADMVLTDDEICESASEGEGEGVDAPTTTTAAAKKRAAAISNTKTSKTRKQYTIRTKIAALHALNLKSQSAVETELGIGHGTLTGWVRHKDELLASSLPLSRRRLWGGGRLGAINFGQVVDYSNFLNIYSFTRIINRFSCASIRIF